MSNELDHLKRLGGVEEVEKPATPKARDGTVGILTMHHPAVRKQLKELAVETEKSQQELMAEAMNMLFLKYNRKPIA